MGNFDNIVDVKKDYIYINDFEQILNKFLTIFNYVKLLCKKI